jgi:PAS domain S-box-containing protein
MQSAPLPQNEAERLARLRGIGLLDSLPQQAFDDITALAASICGTPIALISLVDQDRQWFKSRLGLAVPQTPREIAFCSHAILQPDQIMVVPDATQDVRFQGNPLVDQDPAIRFYAGAPILTDDGLPLGTVCVIDTRARELSEVQLHSLKSLSSLVSTLVEHFCMQREEAQRNSAEMQLRNQMLQALLTSGRELKSFVDHDYTYRFVNPSYLEYWCQQPDDIVGRQVSDIMGKAQFEQTVQPQLDRALAGEAVHYAAEITFPRLGLRHFEISYLPARDAQGQVFGVVVRASDVQERREREDTLKKAVALLEHKTLAQDRFIHIVSHDLREPINTINNFVALLKGDDRIVWPAGARRSLEFVQSGGQRMEALLDGLLDFVRLDNNALQRQRVDISQLAAQLRDDLDSAMERTGGQIQFGHLPETMGDPTLLRIALQNLVTNGLKFSRAGVPPVVRLSYERVDGAIQLSISDNGIGIPADQLQSIFDPFKRLHSRRHFEGTGLGLSICQRIIEMHGGRVAATSAPGVGSCFTITLPEHVAQTEERLGDEHL